MKRYELSLSKNYVSDWGVEEAIRELLQNAKDSDSYEEVYIDKGEGTIIISNANTSIPSSTLLLGNTSKKDDLEKIGQFGEGYKLAILVLLREGKGVLIKNGNKLWTPSFQYSDNFGCEVLCIDESSISGQDLVFQISGFEASELYNLENKFLGLNGKDYNTIKTSYGEILTDYDFKGKVFVDGLPVYQDDNFEYGYNFEPCYVTLDRDRKSINIYELKTLTALSVACCTDNFTFVDEVIEGKGKDGEYIKDKEIELSSEFKGKYADHLIEKLEIKDSDVVVCESSKELITELDRKPDCDVKIVSHKIYADIINEKLDHSSAIISQIKQEQANRDKIANAWHQYEYSDYKTFYEWFKKYNNNLDDFAVEAFKEALSCIEPFNFYLIKDKVWK